MYDISVRLFQASALITVIALSGLNLGILTLSVSGISFFSMFTHTQTLFFLLCMNILPLLETRQLNLSPLVKREKVRRAREKQRSECGKKKKDFPYGTKRAKQAVTKSELFKAEL